MLCLSFIDPALGRLDYDSLSDQTLMELLLDRFVLSQWQDENGCLKNACDWPIVSCTNDRVVDIFFEKAYFGPDQFEFRFLPPLLEYLSASFCNLHGSLDTSLLPRNFGTFDVQFNGLSGTLDWINFPRKLKSMHITHNSFTGSVVLSDLPDSLDTFEANGNNFTGELSFRSLPTSLYRLDLSDNELTGSITIDEMHSSIWQINLGSNSFFGDFRLFVIPPKLKLVVVIENEEMSGTAVLPKSIKTEHFRLWYDGIKVVRDEDGRKHPWEDKIIEANDPLKNGAHAYRLL